MCCKLQYVFDLFFFSFYSLLFFFFSACLLVCAKLLIIKRHRDAPGSSERAVRMETATAAGQALAGTAVAALKEFAEYLDKRNVDLGRLRTQIAERDKALNSYDEARAQLDKLRKKPVEKNSHRFFSFLFFFLLVSIISFFRFRFFLFLL